MSHEAAERWERVQELFLTTLELRTADRIARLGAMEPGDRHEVEALLAAHEDAGPVAERRDDSAEATAAQRIGPFRLENLLGAGGMGAVFSALREGPDFSQRVALKLIRAGFADPRLEEQLKHERRILARLEHPGIARFVDGGTTETGQSWLAMEYVEGQPLREYCRSQGVDTVGRLRLMLAVCEAISHAHQRLVVHGDLKPSNILVGAEGRPKVLDFGIAELLEPSGAPARMTSTAPWMTPAYASPEQVAGMPPTTLTDVYALGVILYELLAEGRPYRVDAGTPEEIRRIIQHTVPEPPSARATTSKLRREVAGDLDAIVLKALAKEPGNRYASVEALADDIRRRLAARPVRAHPDSLGYRVTRFTRRHRIAVGTAALLVVSLVLGIAAVLWQGAVARRERDRAQSALLQSEALSSFLINLFQAADPRSTRGDTTVARALLQRGLAAIDGLDSQPAVQARMLDALGAIVVELGQVERGRRLLERGLAVRQATLGPKHPDVAASLKHIGRAMRAQAAYVQADSVYREALAIERADGAPDGDAEAETLAGLGFLMPYLAKNRESEAFYREALAIRTQVLPPDDPRIDASRILVAAALTRKGDDAGAEALVRDVLASARARYGPDHALTADAAIRLADIISTRPDAAVEAESLYRRVLAIRRSAGAELGLGHPLGNLATLLGSLDRGAEAEQLLRENLALGMRIFGRGSGGEAAGSWALALELLRQGRLREAEALSRRAVELWRLASGPEHPTVGVGLNTLADIVEAEGRLPEAERIAREALALRRRVLDSHHPHIGLSLVQIGRLRMRQGAYRDAESMLLEAVGILEPQTTPTHSDIRSAYQALAQLYDHLGRTGEAARYRALTH